MKSIIFEISAIEVVAKDLIATINKFGAKIIGFSGPLGAGKTTLIGAIAHELGCGQFAVTSPTFTIMHTYECATGPITHVDLYRLTERDQETIAMIEEQIQISAYAFIEWPELLPSIKKQIKLNIELEHIDEHRRRLTITHP
jgi:tRNA threonylcarbamoyladenosine biosynthesis protein TsaE